MTIDTHDREVTRARVDFATAAYFPDNRRIVVVADHADIDAALTALTELRCYMGWVSARSCLCLPGTFTYSACPTHGQPRGPYARTTLDATMDP